MQLSRRKSLETGTVLDVRDEPVHVRGVPQRASKHLHAAAAGGRWTWNLGGPVLSKLAPGRCLDGPQVESTA